MFAVAVVLALRELTVIVALGLRAAPLWVLAPAVAIAVGQVWTLLRIREVLATLPF